MRVFIDDMFVCLQVELGSTQQGRIEDGHLRAFFAL